MRMFTYIIIFFAYFSCSLLIGQSGIHSHGYHLSLSSPTTLSEVFSQISLSYKLSLSYAEEWAQDQPIGPINIQAATLSDFLDQLFLGLNISYKILDKHQVLIRKVENYRRETPDNVVTIKGKVVDKETQLPLMYAMIRLDTMRIGTLTDEHGYFLLRIPSHLSYRTCYIRMLGYQSIQKTVEECRLKPDIELVLHPYSIEPVDIKDRSPALFISPDQLSLNIQHFASTYASTLGQSDLFRSVQLLPGVQGTDDLDAGIKIRGSEDNETLIVLDGIPIYKAAHFFGIYSSISSDYVEEAQLYKNALPAEYGGKTGGMLLLQSTDSIRRWKSQVSINTLTASAQIEAPINDQLSLLVQGRTSYSNAAESSLFDGVNQREMIDLGDFIDPSRPSLVNNTPALQFYDLNAKLIVKPGKKHFITLNGFRSQDQFTNDYVLAYRTRSRNNPIANIELFQQGEDWSNTGASINYRYRINNNARLFATMFYSQYDDGAEITSSIRRSRANEEVRSAFTNVQSVNLKDIGGTVKLEYKVKDNQRIEVGSGGTYHDNSFSFFADNNNIFANDDQVMEWNTFGQYQWLVNKDWLIQAGVRLSYFGLTEQLYASPRWNTSYQLSGTFSIKGSFSRDNQFLREIIHENRLGQSIDFMALADGDSIPLGQSDNYMLGATFSKGDWLVDLELYHKDQANVLEHALLVPGFNSIEETPVSRGAYQLFSGSSTTNGLDLLISYSPNSYSGWLAYTLSKSTQSFEEILRGEAFPKEDDRRHQIKWINQYSVGRFDFSANWIFSSGRPYSDFSVLTREQDRRMLTVEDRIRRLPAYQRIDLGVNYHIPLGRHKLSLGSSVFNLTNHQNVRYIQYIYSVPSNLTRNESALSRIIGTETNLLNRTFNLSLTWKWE